MGWYTSGPNDFEYKFGDVVALARSCGLGRLLAVPRTSALDDEDELLEVDDLEFLGPLQEIIEAKKLPWRHVELSKKADPSGESIEVATDVISQRSTRWRLCSMASMG